MRAITRVALANGATGEGAALDAAAAADLVVRVATEVCRACFADGLIAVVLTGSLARGEATFRDEGGQTRLFGDADFLLVLERQERRPAPEELSRAASHIQTELAGRGLMAHTTLAAVPLQYFPAMPRHIFTYELKNCGQVVWGNASVLGMIPAFATAEISREDAWRLLSNRMIEQIEAGPENLLYSSVKFCLDLATSLLVFAGAYEPSYGARAARLAELAAKPSVAPVLPFPIAPFSRLVSACTAWKLGDRRQNLPDVDSLHKRVIAYAHLLWRWELQALTDGNTDSPDTALLARMRRKQSLRARLRGWMFVVRKCAWARSAPYWPRWIRLAFHGSPRYCIYSAAAEFVFYLDGSGAEPRRWLPIPAAGRSVGADIAWNYHEFLEGTRA